MKNLPVTVARVNAALKAAGHAERLKAGRGYYYFTEGNAHHWRATSVYVYRVWQLSVERWLAERDDLAREYENRTSENAMGELR